MDKHSSANRLYELSHYELSPKNQFFIEPYPLSVELYFTN